MFNDLTNTSLNNIPLSDVKAAPSENSPNDGGFNNEENLRWLTKKLVSKPFIIGDTETELSSAFSATTDENGNDIIRSGMFSIDGYTFKLADPEHISFDDENSGTFTPMDKRYIQRFIEGLVNQGTSDALTTNLEKVLRSDYNPNNYTTSTESQLISKWKSAYNNQLCIGYLKFKYTGSYAEELDVFNTIEVSYGNNKVVQASQVLVDPTDPILPTDTPDQIWSKLQNSTQSGWIKSRGDAFAVVNSSTDIDIYYGLVFKDCETWDTTKNEYKKSQRLEFVDIFGLTFFYNNTATSSNCYPATQNVDINLGGNTLLSNLPFTDCKLATYPNYLYNFEDLYDENSDRYTVDDSITYTGSAFPDYTTFFTTLFDVKTTSDLLTNYVPIGNPGNIAKVETDMSYFCIKNIPNNLKKSYIGSNNETIYIPVSFMTSEGSLTPNGFLIDSTTTCNTYPVEGYLHFIKRLYCEADPDLDADNETVVNRVTVQQLCSWTTSDETYGNFRENYDTYILPYISMYIHLCYCSLLDNVAYGYKNDGTSATYDYEKIKSIDCGIQLDTSGYGVLGEFDTVQQYSAVEYNYDNNTNTFIPSTVVKEVHYNKNLTSDNTKIINFTTDEIWKDTSNNPLTFFYYVRALASNDPNYPIQFDDPINYYRQCALTDSTVPLGNKNGVVTSVSVSRIDFTGGIVSLQTVDKNVAVYSPWTGHGLIMDLVIDQYLMPTRPTGWNNRFEYTTLPAMFGTNNIASLNGTGDSNSIINGMCYNWNQANWITYIPCTATIKKDSHNYLRGKDFDQPNSYAGLELSYTLPGNTDNNTCYLYNLEISTDLTTGTNDTEKPDTNIDINSKYIKRRRESIFHINKIYGDNYITIQDLISQMFNLGDLQEDLNTLKRTSIVTYPGSRIGILIGTNDPDPDPTLASIIVDEFPSNKYIEIIIHMNEVFVTPAKSMEFCINQAIESGGGGAVQTHIFDKLKVEGYFDYFTYLGILRIYNYGDTIDYTDKAYIIADILGNPVLKSMVPPGTDISRAILINSETSRPWITWDGNFYNIT